MLDVDTKRRIDTARDILVGKVPDPKSQVEQMTIALIYKFMDDLDSESEELGGERTFFAGHFARYGWAKLMHPSLGGFETLNLYAEAIARMPENPSIPPLFRNIFNNAYLPYHDPETLRAFLKVIDEFSYDHSERLGDAFEYLLSILGAQGDAGQFRTPRHIIDFIVAVVDPKKDEAVLDPACGTAGFLISAYKYILAANTGSDGHSTLTPDNRDRLVRNFSGYDISPDMVRLSLVNMYLHGFPEPHIHEYDTLTSEERWNEYADVILANPPFMSPRGGIRPHNRFSVQSKRSEVLFVDYIAEHLSPEGRAGIIVPEGIVFQSQTAYKQLRKMLVEDYLVAVISLPTGVFNPYSGVKTSILILDRALARRTDDIAFFKVEYDGFDLGAHRRPVSLNDLPRVEAGLCGLLRHWRAGEPASELNLTNAHVVSKGKIAEDGDYNLSGERYRITGVHDHAFPLVSLGDAELFAIESGGTPRSDEMEYWGGGIPWATLADLPPNEIVSEIRATQRTISEAGLSKSSAKLIPENSVVVSTRATIGRVGVNRVPLATNQGFKNIVILDSSLAIPEYVALAVTKLVPVMEAWASGGTFKEISKSKFSELQIPLPPLELQRELVAEIDGYQRMIAGARAVVENYQPRATINPEWPVVTLGDICSLISGQHINSDEYNTDGVGIGYLTGPADFGDVFTSFSKWTTNPKIFAQHGDVLITVKGSGLGKVNLLSAEEATIGRQLMAIRTTNAVPEYIYIQLTGMYDYIQSRGSGAAIPGITRDDVLKLRLPLPDLKEQETIVTEWEREMELVNANRELIARFEKKIDAAVGSVWEANASMKADA